MRSLLSVAAIVMAAALPGCGPVRVEAAETPAIPRILPTAETSATSSSPLGPFTNAANNPIVVQSGAVQGAGHHSVAQIPGRDEWVIAYHRFHIPGGDGYHRETCLSPLRFDEQGQVRKVDVFEAVTSLAPGSDGQAPWQERPGILPIEFDATGRVRLKHP
jgi:hypothetical protein